MFSNFSLIFALIVWPLVYMGLLCIMRRARIPSPYGVEFLVAFATIGELFLQPLTAPGLSMMLYASAYIFFAVLSLVCMARLLFHPSRSPFYPVVLVLLAVGILLPWIIFFT
jgi:hypothetical protein